LNLFRVVCFHPVTYLPWNASTDSPPSDFFEEPAAPPPPLEFMAKIPGYENITYENGESCYFQSIFMFSFSEKDKSVRINKRKVDTAYHKLEG
jgi:hypothetical protein